MNRLLLALSLIGLTSIAHAGEKRSLPAHEHGVGTFNIAFEGREVAIEFSAPGADIVGFEYVAKSAEDRKKVDAGIAALAKPLSLFRLPEAAKCTLVAAEVELHDEEDDEPEKHGEKDHDHDHDQKKPDDKDHAEHDDDHKEATHTEFHAEYRLNCAVPQAINQIVFEYFSVFPNAKELEVQFVSDKGANGFEVERSNPVLELNGLI